MTLFAVPEVTLRFNELQVVLVAPLMPFRSFTGPSARGKAAGRMRRLAAVVLMAVCIYSLAAARVGPSVECVPRCESRGQ